MVKFYSSDYTYDYGFSAVSLAYFLRYPNPYSKHVASTDTISRSYDPETQRLTTVRLHLKKSRLPPAILKLLPRSSLGASEDGNTQSFILEKSVVDIKEGWMETESRNLNWNNVLSVIERHTYRRSAAEGGLDQGNMTTNPSNAPTTALRTGDYTHVAVSVTLKSKIGEQIRKQRQRWGQQAPSASIASNGDVVPAEDEAPARQGWFNSWTSGAVRSAIENISLQRTERSQPKAKEGMSVVLARLRSGGLEAVLEGMKADVDPASI